MPAGGGLEGDPVVEDRRGAFLLFFREPGSCRASFLVNHEGLLWEKEESVDWLNSRKLEENKAFYGKQDGCTEETAQLRFRNGSGSGSTPAKVRAVNASHPRFLELLSGEAFPQDREKAGPYPGHRGCGEHAPYGPPSVGRRRDLPDRDLRYLRPGDGPVGV